ncbi:uncharacterized protein LOC100214368 isoform X1 [Hydra vulgaris]|uniref:uncharacterized protein LOC100214368 isoform X1 n=1 Tax=Hydra vulgaris TaxID=6087 RepID=UPI001F5EC177|nr:protein ZINC INDUCED FACILITATOR-LIKE 1 isoform X2 [Hydra vulgaris]
MSGTTVKKHKNVLLKEGTTPVRKGVCFAVSILMFCHGATVTSVFPYLPKFVKELGFSEVEIGAKTGLLASAMFMCMIFSSLIWGYTCDNWGRKLSVYLCAGGLALTTILFGFSCTYTWAILSRSSQGLFLGLIGITKVIITDVSDDSNLGVGLTFMFASYNLGLIVGPSMAGFLAFPAEKYPHMFYKDSFISRLKILIPNLILSVCIFISIVVTILFVPKNTQKNENNKKIILEKDDSFTLSKDEDTYLNCSILSNSYSVNFSGNLDSLKQKNTLIDLFRNLDFVIVLVFYGFQSLTIIAFEELFPVHAATEISYSGYGMSESEIGTVFLIVASVVIVLQLTIIRNTMNRIGAKKMLSAATLGFGFLIILMPTVGMVKHKLGFWITMCIHQILIRSMMSSGFLAINMLLNNSVSSLLLGTANGLAMSVTAIGRAIGPTIFGIAYSWSLKNVENALRGKKSLRFPFNEYFAFLLIGLTSFFLFLLGTRIPERFNKRKIDAEENPLIIRASFLKYDTFLKL